MDAKTILAVILAALGVVVLALVLFLGGGGFFWSRRGR